MKVTVDSDFKTMYDLRGHISICIMCKYIHTCVRERRGEIENLLVTFTVNALDTKCSQGVEWN